MATTNGSGNWSAGATWVGGVVPPDDDPVTIQPGHLICMDADLSAYTGLRTVTITGVASGTPGMLYWKDGTSGYLKIRTGYNFVGTNHTVKGRLLANSDGVWGNTGSLTNANKAVVLLEGTSKIDATHLDIALYGTNPTRTYVETYKTAYTCTTQSTDVNPATDVITFTGAPPAAGTAVIVRSSGTLPGGLIENAIYYTRTISGNTCKLALQNADAQIVDITSTGSGTLTMYDGHTNTGTATINVIQDVTGDAPWTTTAGHNRAVLVNIGPSDQDVQAATLSTINTGAMALSANVDSVQYPGARIYLSARNVSIRSTGTSTSQAIVDFSGADTRSGIFNCEITNTSSSGANLYGSAIYSGAGHTFNGVIANCRKGFEGGSSSTITGVIAGVYYGTQDATLFNISGHIVGAYSGIYSYYQHRNTMSGFMAGCTQAMNYGSNTISGTILGCSKGLIGATSVYFNGVISGCTYGMTSTTNSLLFGTIVGCGTGINNSIGCLIDTDISYCATGISGGEARVTGTISKCTSGISNGLFTGYGLSFSGNTSDVSSSMPGLLYSLFCRSFNHAGVANATRAWSPGGTMTHDTSVYPSGKTYSSKFTHTVSTEWTRMEWEIDRTDPLEIAIPVHALHDGTGLTSGQRIHWELIDPTSDPLLGGTALVQWIAEDSASWQSSYLIYTRTDDRKLIVRASAKQGSGNSWIYLDQSAFSYAALEASITAIKAKTDYLPADTNTLLVSTGIKAATVADKTGYALSSAGVQAIWDALTSALTTVGSIGKRIVDYLDAAISSRSTYAGDDTSGTTTLLSRVLGTLASGTHQPQSGDAYAKLPASPASEGSVNVIAGYVDTEIAAIQAAVAAIPTTPLLAANYTDPPSVSAIRAEMDANSTKLANLDVAVSTRLAPSGTLATVTTLTNAPDVPTDAEIAAAVWAYVTRTITSGGITPQQVWEYVSTLLPDGAEAMLAGIAERMAEQVPTGPVQVLPASGPGQTTAWVMCVDEAGEVAAGVEIYIQMVATAAIGAFSAATQILISDADGLAAGPIPRGADHRFRARRGSAGVWVPFGGADADTLALPAILGAP